jgi:hypothetical protein
MPPDLAEATGVVVAFDGLERRLSFADTALLATRHRAFAVGGRIELDAAAAAAVREALAAVPENELSGRARALLAALDGERFPED